MAQPKIGQPIPSKPKLGQGYESMANNAAGPLPWSWARKRLEKSHSYWIVTVRLDGRPHSVPVWGCWIDESFMFSTGPDTRKADNLKHNPHCVICPDDLAHAISVEGAVEVETRADVLERFVAAYNLKYHWNSTVDDGPFFTVRPRLAMAFMEPGDEFYGRATRWKFSAR